jgi:RNA polymerase sigma factor (sigma-70 family)
METQPPVEPHQFGITVTAQMRHAALWEACKQFGSAKAMAQHLGVSETKLGQWMNLRAVPCRTRLRADVAQRLMTVTGQSLEELFPRPLHSQDFLDAPKAIEHTRSMDPCELAAAGIARRFLQPDERLEQRDLQRVLAQAMTALPMRHHEALRLRFGLDGQAEHSWEALARKLGVSGERCRQLVQRGLMRLRQSKAAALLRVECLE